MTPFSAACSRTTDRRCPASADSSTGFTLVLHPHRRLTVHTADGVPVLHHPTQPWADPAALAQGRGQRIRAETLPPDHCDARMDLGYIVNVVMAQAS